MLGLAWENSPEIATNVLYSSLYSVSKLEDTSGPATISYAFLTHGVEFLKRDEKSFPSWTKSKFISLSIGSVILSIA